jgi:hypothetical protein
MSNSGPQSLSVKRKRTEAPVDALILDSSAKRQKATPTSHIYRRLTKPNDAPHQTLTPFTPTAQRTFQLDATARARNKHVFIEATAQQQQQNGSTHAQQNVPTIQPTPQETPRARKRPGAGSALNRSATPSLNPLPQSSFPTAKDVQELEALSKQVEKEDNLYIPLPSPSKHRPKAPAQRFADRHPDKAAALGITNGDDAMDIDTDEYVYDTYIREVIMPDADGKLPEPTGTVGLLVISEEDEDWWNGEDESDKEFDTDDEDENAEDYYANDYPEDELDEDDEFGRNPYQSGFRKGSDDEEYNLDDSDDAVRSGEDEDDVHFRMTVPKAQRVGYWGAVGEA